MAKKNRDRSERSRSRRRGQRDEDAESELVVVENGSSNSNFSTLAQPGTPPDEHGIQPNNNKTESNGQQEEELSEIDDFDQKLELVLDQLQSSKSGRARLQTYESLAKALTTRFCFDYFDNRRMTIQDILEHSLKRLDDETGSAAFTLSLLLITMGTSDSFANEIFQDLFDYLHRVLSDHGAKPSVRAKCATALGLGCFISDYGLEKTRPVLTELLSIAFSPVKGSIDPAQQSGQFNLKATCLDMFSFLVSNESDAYMSELLTDNIKKLSACLETPNLALRVAAGECMALLVEHARLVDSDFELEQMDLICEKLHQLATDSQKSRSKKELREQRSNFRQILRTIEGDEFGEESVKVGGYDRVIIDGWQMKRYYDTLCSVLGSGMNLHLAQNPLLRDIFGLGPVVVSSQLPPGSSRASKLEKQYINNCNRKAREMHRNKQRRRQAEMVD